MYDAVLFEWTALAIKIVCVEVVLVSTPFWSRKQMQWSAAKHFSTATGATPWMVKNPEETIVDATQLVGDAHYNWLERAPVAESNIKDIRLNAQDVIKTDCGSYTLSFWRGRHGIVLKYMPRVAYFSSFDRSKSKLAVLPLSFLSVMLLNLLNEEATSKS